MLPTALAPALTNAAQTAITRVLSSGGVRTTKPTGEVSAVRTLTLDGFDEISAAWSPILRAVGCKINLQAVFCHSRPHVDFTEVPHPKYPGGIKPRRCELADLLIVIDHFDPATRSSDRRAALIQAKLLKNGQLRPSGREWVQHELLAWLPGFRFVDVVYNSRSRDLKGPSTVGVSTYTAVYGGIDLKSSTPIWQHELPTTISPWFMSTEPLADYLAGMATGTPKEGRQAAIGGQDDWSFTVDELLKVTAKRDIVQGSGVLRGNAKVVGFVVDTSSRIGRGSGGGSGFIEGKFPDWPEGPISTVHVTFSPLDD
jgi:hypothetical protein